MTTNVNVEEAYLAIAKLAVEIASDSYSPQSFLLQQQEKTVIEQYFFTR